MRQIAHCELLWLVYSYSQDWVILQSLDPNKATGHYQIRARVLREVVNKLLLHTSLKNLAQHPIIVGQGFWEMCAKAACSLLQPALV